MNENFVRELPQGYLKAKEINAKRLKVGIVINLIACAVMLIFIAGFILLGLFGLKETVADDDGMLSLFIAMSFGALLGTAIFIPLVICHELLHGAAYKRLTGEKLTFGLTLSVAFCGVPNIYVSRRTSIISCAMPLIVVSAILLPVSAASFLVATLTPSFVFALIYFASSFLFSLHLGGCVGDIWVILILLTKFKSPDTLVRDTGPIQTFYIKTSSEAEP